MTKFNRILKLSSPWDVTWRCAYTIKESFDAYFYPHSSLQCLLNYKPHSLHSNIIAISEIIAYFWVRLIIEFSIRILSRTRNFMLKKNLTVFVRFKFVTAYSEFCFLTFRHKVTVFSRFGFVAAYFRMRFIFKFLIRIFSRSNLKIKIRI